MRTLLMLIGLSLAFSTSGWAVEPEAPPDLSALGWMAGSWIGEAGESVLEETWLAPSESSMVGVNRTVRAGRTVGFEFLRIERDEHGIVYLASPGGRCPPTAFRLIELGDHRVVFANPAHDFPQHIIYWRDGNELFARIEGTVHGEARSSEWSWRSAK